MCDEKKLTRQLIRALTRQLITALTRLVTAFKKDKERQRIHLHLGRQDITFIDIQDDKITFIQGDAIQDSTQQNARTIHRKLLRIIQELDLRIANTQIEHSYAQKINFLSSIQEKEIENKHISVTAENKQKTRNLLTDGTTSPGGQLTQYDCYSS